MNIIYQDNKMPRKMEMNGKTSSGKRTRHFEIKYYYITDLVNQNKVSIKYCSTNDMTADYRAKPIVGTKFNTFWSKVRGKGSIVVQQECVGISKKNERKHYSNKLNMKKRELPKINGRHLTKVLKVTSK